MDLTPRLHAPSRSDCIAIKFRSRQERLIRGSTPKRCFSWAPKISPDDLIFANAALQWADDPIAVTLRLYDMLAPGGVIALHDCCPTDENMAKRDYTGGLWTGDVWKTLLILLRHRPDLDIRVASAEPTGLVVVRGLDPENRVLSQVYDKAVVEYSEMRLSDLPGGLGGLYRHFRLEPPSVVLSGLTG